MSSSLSTSERDRLLALCHFENVASAQGFQTIAGVDEAGRGPLAGPVVAAACILPKGMLIEGIDDSKKLTSAQRQKLFVFITQHPDILFGIGIADAQLIDEINILQATFVAMNMAVEKLSKKPDYLLVDGLHIPLFPFPAQGIVKGDSRSQSIAAASILAKVARDQLMQEFHALWPVYGFDKHKGYGTKQHLNALAMHGPCRIHRLTFAPCSPSDSELSSS